MTVAIDNIGAQGDGVGVVDGVVIHAPLTAPGDEAVIDLAGDRGTLVDLAHESPHRVSPPCSYYGVCGGCSLQHIERGYYLSWKRQRIVDALARKGLGDAMVDEVIAAPEASRRRARLKLRRSGRRAVLGFHARRSGEIIEIESCKILRPQIEKRLGALGALVGLLCADRLEVAVNACENGLDVEIHAPGIEEPRGEALGVFITAARSAGAARVSLNGSPLIMLSPPVIRFGGVAVHPPPGAFLQASAEGEAALAELVGKACSGARKIADLFCGCGTFSLPLAHAASVAAFDADEPAVAALDAGARRAQGEGTALNPVKTCARNLFERPLTAKELSRFDAVIFDPPRAGASAQAAEIARSKASIVVGVSCNPSTFARDARILVDGGYKLSRVTPVDQFVWSPHVELVGVFKRR